MSANELHAIANAREEYSPLHPHPDVTKKKQEEISSDEEVKSWPFGDINVDSPIGILCRGTDVNISLFRARDNTGAYSCYLGMTYTLFGGAGYTNPAWIALDPVGGLALSVVLRSANWGFLGEFLIPRQRVDCGDNRILVSHRVDKVNPDIYPLAEIPALWTLKASWYSCAQ